MGLVGCLWKARLQQRPVRRSFTAAYRLAIVAEYEAAPRGEKGAVLRRKGLYHSHVKEWTAARDAGARAGVGDGRKSAPGSKGSAKDRGEVERLRAQNLRLTAQLAQTRTALDMMGKAHVYAGDPCQEAASSSWSRIAA
jgi:transposase